MKTYTHIQTYTHTHTHTHTHTGWAPRTSTGAGPAVKTEASLVPEVQAHDDNGDDDDGNGRDQEGTELVQTQVPAPDQEGTAHSSDPLSLDSDRDEDEPELKPMLPPEGWVRDKPDIVAKTSSTPLHSTPASGRSVPTWIGKPSTFSNDTTQSVELQHSGLCAPLVETLQRNGIHKLFPVQAALIPQVLAGAAQPYHPGDVCVSAPTGSGKTLAYVLPLIQCLHQRIVRRVRAVVVVPTRDLVIQVKQVFDAYCHSIAVVTANKLAAEGNGNAAQQVQARE